jgi:Flp pilus assembly pilin Flp
MNELFRALFRKFTKATVCDRGANMVEFALLVALLACGTTAGMASTAKGFTKAYKQINTNLKSEMPKKPKKG